MKANVLNYRIIVEKEKHKKGYVYVAYAPSLGVSDFGKTVDKAVSNIEEAIQIYIESLIQVGEPVPTPDADDYYVTKAQITLPHAKISFA